MPDPGPEEQAPNLDLDEASGAARRSHGAGARAIRPGGSARAESRRETHGRRGRHGDLGVTDVRASARAGGAGGRAAAVVKVSPAFEAAIRAEARAAAREVASERTRDEPTLATREAVSDYIRTKVRAAAHELLRTEARGQAQDAARGHVATGGPLRRDTRRGFP
jgi:hypothetical protein